MIIVMNQLASTMQCLKKSPRKARELGNAKNENDTIIDENDMESL